jgi:hypothetical protein
MSTERSRGQMLAATTAFVSLFAIVGLALYGLPFFYDFMVKEFGWTRAQVTSGNAYSKLVIGPLFGFFGRLVRRSLRLAQADDRRHPASPACARSARRDDVAADVLHVLPVQRARLRAGRGRCPNQVLLSRGSTRDAGRAMGFAYLGHRRRRRPGAADRARARSAPRWHAALQLLGVLMIASRSP